MLFAAIKGVHAPVRSRTRASCALPTEGECGTTNKRAAAAERQDGRSLPPHRKIRVGSGNFTPCRVVLALETAEDIRVQKQ